MPIWSKSRTSCLLSRDACTSSLPRSWQFRRRTFGAASEPMSRSETLSPLPLPTTSRSTISTREHGFLASSLNESPFPRDLVDSLRRNAYRLVKISLGRNQRWGKLEGGPDRTGYDAVLVHAAYNRRHRVILEWSPSLPVGDEIDGKPHAHPPNLADDRVRVEILTERIQQIGPVFTALFDQPFAFLNPDHRVRRGGCSGVPAKRMNVAEDWHCVNDLGLCRHGPHWHVPSR